MSSKNASYVPWNEEMEVTLLYLIVIGGVHVAPRSESTKKWNTVNDLFFDQNEILPYKAAAYKKDDNRKLNTGKVSDPESLLLYVGFNTPG
jgi:hypothetical protein